MALPDSEDLFDRRRAHEDEYFRRRDRELVETARLQAEDEAARRRLARATGIDDDAILRDLQALGYTAETVRLLSVMPLVAVAWADGSVSAPERDVITRAARGNGIEPESRADSQLTQWLANPPSEAVHESTLRALTAIFQTRPPEARAEAIRHLRASCTSVAWASGGILGFHVVSNTEQSVLDRILDVLGTVEVSSPHAEKRRASSRGEADRC
jgi:hypothetical protein